MKILIATGLYPPSIGGPATYAKLLEDELPQHGIEVDIFSYDSVRHLPKGISHFVFFFGLLKRGARADLLYTLDPVSTGLPTCIASKLLRKKFILRVPGDYAWEQGFHHYNVKEMLDEFVTKKYSGKVGLLQKIQARVARHADRVITPSQYLKNIVMAWGISEEKITVILNSFEDIPEEVKSISREALQKELHLYRPTIISVGRLVPWKGFKTLITLVSRIQKVIPKTQLLIIGDGEMKKELQDKIRTLGMEDSIFLLGKKSKTDVYKYLKVADVFVLNTGYEGLSHLLLEALAVETPVVTTTVGGNPEVITSEENGLLVPYNDARALEQAIVSVLQNPEQASGYTKNGTEKLQQFDKDKMIQLLIETLKKSV